MMDVFVTKNDTCKKNKDNKPLIMYFIISFILAWILMGVVIGQNYGFLKGNLPIEPLLIVGAWSPNLAAIIILKISVRRKGATKALFWGWAKWRVKPIWYILTLSPIVVSFITIYLYNLLYRYYPSTGVLTNPFSFLFLLIMATLTGATGEQLGWRGFALPWLQTKMNALFSSILLGFIWSLWHLPLWFAGIGYETIPFGAYTLIGISFSIVVTWACNNTEGSMVIASLFHLFLNVSINLLNKEAYTIYAVVFFLASVFITIIYGPQKLSREKSLPINYATRAWKEDND